MLYLAGTFGAIFLFWHKLADSDQLSCQECVDCFSQLLFVLDILTYLYVWLSPYFINLKKNKQKKKEEISKFHVLFLLSFSQ